MSLCSYQARAGREAQGAVGPFLKHLRRGALLGAGLEVCAGPFFYQHDDKGFANEVAEFHLPTSDRVSPIEKRRRI